MERAHFLACNEIRAFILTAEKPKKEIICGHKVSGYDQKICAALHYPWAIIYL